MASPYRPTPTIVEAAVTLYEGNGVREISHRHAHNLDRTTAMLVEEIGTARSEKAGASSASSPASRVRARR